MLQVRILRPRCRGDLNNWRAAHHGWGGSYCQECVCHDLRMITLIVPALWPRCIAKASSCVQDYHSKQASRPWRLGWSCSALAGAPASAAAMPTLQFHLAWLPTDDSALLINLRNRCHTILARRNEARVRAHVLLTACNACTSCARSLQTVMNTRACVACSTMSPRCRRLCSVLHMRLHLQFPW